MTHKVLETYLLSFPNAWLDFPFGQGTSVYKVGRKSAVGGQAANRSTHKAIQSPRKDHTMSDFKLLAKNGTEVVTLVKGSAPYVSAARIAMNVIDLASNTTRFAKHRFEYYLDSEYVQASATRVSYSRPLKPVAKQEGHIVEGTTTWYNVARDMFNCVDLAALSPDNTSDTELQLDAIERERENAKAKIARLGVTGYAIKLAMCDTASAISALLRTAEAEAEAHKREAEALAAQQARKQARKAKA